MTKIVLVLSAVNLGNRGVQSQDYEVAMARPAKAVVTYTPYPQVPDEARAKHLKGVGICLLHLRPDGTVARAEMIQPTGEPLLDKSTIDCFSKWRFVPGAITKVRKVKIPITYTGNYAKPGAAH